MSLRPGTEDPRLSPHPPWPRTTVAAFALFVLATLVATWSYHRLHELELLRLSREQLDAVSDLKVAEIGQWLADCRLRVSLATRTPAFLDRCHLVLTEPSNVRARHDLLAWMSVLVEEAGFDRVTLWSEAGRACLITPLGPAEASALPAPPWPAAGQPGQVAMLDLHLGPESGQPCLSFAVSILTAPVAGRPVRAELRFELDPRRYLYPLVQRWPSPSPTAETLLVRAEGDSVLFLNELRHRAGTALKLRMKVLESLDLPAARAVTGQTGILAGRDYRGVPVLAAIRSIPGSPWFLVAKVDLDELRAPLREHAAVAIALASSVLLLGYFGWRLAGWRRTVRDLERELAVEHSRRQDAEALRLLVEEKTVLLREVHHRVRGNLQFLSSLLNLQASTESGKAAAVQLKQTQNRVRAMATLHESLYRFGSAGRVELGAYLRQLCDHISRAYALEEAGVRIVVKANPVELPVEQAGPCGLIVNELVSNSARHAFSGGRQGEIRVGLTAGPGEHLTLEISDTGSGLPADLDPERSGGLGLQLVSMLSHRLGATLTVERGDGSAFRIVVPVPRG